MRAVAGRVEPWCAEVMSDQTQITVERVVDAPASAIFDILTNPGRHHEADASGMVQSSEAKRIQAVGEVFDVNMRYDDGKGHVVEYVTANHVSGYAANKLVAWKPALSADDEPLGWEWVYELESQGSDSTLVRLSYRWGDAPAQNVAKYGVPNFDATALEASLGRLAESVAS